MQADTVQTSELDVLRAENARLRAELVSANESLHAFCAVIEKHGFRADPDSLDVALARMRGTRPDRLEWRGRILYLVVGPWEVLIAGITPVGGNLTTKIYGRRPAEVFAADESDAHRRLSALLALDGLVVPPLPEESA